MVFKEVNSTGHMLGTQQLPPTTAFEEEEEEEEEVLGFGSWSPSPWAVLLGSFFFVIVSKNSF